MFDASIEDNLLKIPSLPLLLGRMKIRLDDEKRQRAEFRSWLTEDLKAEFINGSIVMHSPAADDHNEAVLYLGGAANLFSTLHKLGKVRVEKALIGMKPFDDNRSNDCRIAYPMAGTPSRTDSGFENNNALSTRNLIRPPPAAILAPALPRQRHIRLP